MFFVKYKSWYVCPSTLFCLKEYASMNQIYAMVCLEDWYFGLEAVIHIQLEVKLLDLIEFLP